MKWLVDTIGIDELRRRVLKERKTLMASSTWPGGIPPLVAEQGDAPAGIGTGVDADAGRHAGDAAPGAGRQLPALGDGQRGGRGGQGHRFRLRLLPGWATSRRTSSARLAAIQRDLDVEVRVTNRQNVVFRGLGAVAAGGAARSAWH